MRRTDVHAAGKTSVLIIDDSVTFRETLRAALEKDGYETLIAGTGAPPGTEPACPAGCADNRVILVDRAGKIIWQYGVTDSRGTRSGWLHIPDGVDVAPVGIF